MTSTRQMRGGGGGVTTAIRLRDGLKDAVTAYAMSRRTSVNMVINEALFEYLAAKGQRWVAEIGTAGEGEKA
jgi:predicted transcriptional regulator